MHVHRADNGPNIGIKVAGIAIVTAVALFAAFNINDSAASPPNNELVAINDANIDTASPLDFTVTTSMNDTAAASTSLAETEAPIVNSRTPANTTASVALANQEGRNGGNATDLALTSAAIQNNANTTTTKTANIGTTATIANLNGGATGDELILPIANAQQFDIAQLAKVIMSMNENLGEATTNLNGGGNDDAIFHGADVIRT